MKIWIAAVGFMVHVILLYCFYQIKMKTPATHLMPLELITQIDEKEST